MFIGGGGGWEEREKKEEKKEKGFGVYRTDFDACYIAVIN